MTLNHPIFICSLGRTAGMCVLALAVVSSLYLGLAPMPLAHAGEARQASCSQGTWPQGGCGQGTKGQGTKGHGTGAWVAEGHHAEASTKPVHGQPWSDEWLHGPILVGVLRDRTVERSRTALVHLLAFRGDTVDAYVWTADSGWERRALHPRALVGMEWIEYRCDAELSCDRATYRIVTVAPDDSTNTMRAHSDNSDVWLYQIDYLQTEGTDKVWRPACTEDRDRFARGLFVNGTWYSDGSWRETGYTFACTSGVIAKCVRDWGYKPWKSLVSSTGNNVNLQPLHQACVRAARADYCGNGLSYTRDGTIIDVIDIYGFNIRALGTEFRDEAGFSWDGATWIQRTRWPVGERKAGFFPDSVVTLPTCIRPKRETYDHDAAQTLVTVRSLPRP